MFWIVAISICIVDIYPSITLAHVPITCVSSAFCVLCFVLYTGFTWWHKLTNSILSLFFKKLSKFVHCFLILDHIVPIHTGLRLTHAKEDNPFERFSIKKNENAPKELKFRKNLICEPSTLRETCSISQFSSLFRDYARHQLWEKSEGDSVQHQLSFVLICTVCTVFLIHIFKAFMIGRISNGKVFGRWRLISSVL